MRLVKSTVTQQLRQVILIQNLSPREELVNRDKEAVTRSPKSRYRSIPTKNVKFEKFIELIFKSRMQTQEVKDEIIKYVQALETSYTDTIRDLKVVIDREKIK